MYYTIYKTTNIINGKFYIGKHQTDDPYDRYFGSGKALLAAIRKHGKKNFVKEVLCVFDNPYDMDMCEQQLVTAEVVANPMSYNIGIGGEGGPHFQGKTHSDVTRAVLSAKGKVRICAEETRQKISENNRNRVITDSTRLKISEKAILRYQSDDVREKISEGMKKFHARKRKILRGRGVWSSSLVS